MLQRMAIGSGVRVCHVNSTAYGGGVAELLSRYLPLIQGLGISAEWRLIHGAPEFFTVTKSFHNALQGAHYDLPKSARALYLSVNEESAELLDANYDVIVVHDPQPAAIRHFAGRRNAKWLWRCHNDSSAADTQVVDFLAPYIDEYDALVFTMPAFWARGSTRRAPALLRPPLILSPPRISISQLSCGAARSRIPGSIWIARCFSRCRDLTPGRIRSGSWRRIA
jgi:trehalose synthase